MTVRQNVNFVDELSERHAFYNIWILVNNSRNLYLTSDETYTLYN